jgi:regulator of extracellular matrix RemA (YlzA/DUF370 family)
MKLTASKLDRLIEEVMKEDNFYGEEYSTFLPPQKKVPKTSETKSKSSFIDAAIAKRIRLIDIKDKNKLANILSDELDKVIDEVIAEFMRENNKVNEEAPPGREEQVMKLKKKFCDGKKDCPRAYATAWASHNKAKK